MRAQRTQKPSQSQSQSIGVLSREMREELSLVELDEREMNEECNGERENRRAVKAGIPAD